ncbi:type II toxin-antitoxin system RelE/ParE family toxin [Kluyvera sp. CHPC 1.251]|uniref:type II toxin-antitoxin system RelE/ParE family toxin n=1 Tax=Kluyvera sp. CHPC 1.251 TaxID=2995175 RepID=UPI002FD7B732
MFKILVHTDVRDEMLTLPASAQAKMIGKIEKLRLNPTALREPDSKSLPHGLFEIRTVGMIHCRGIYAFQQGKTIFLLRVFIKKTQKTPPAELRLALKRLQEMQDE